MNELTLLALFIGLPSVVYLGLKIESSRRQRKYKEQELGIQNKYQNNLFVLKKSKAKISKQDNNDDDFKKAS